MTSSQPEQNALVPVERRAVGAVDQAEHRGGRLGGPDRPDVVRAGRVPAQVGEHGGRVGVGLHELGEAEVLAPVCANHSQRAQVPAAGAGAAAIRARTAAPSTAGRPSVSTASSSARAGDPARRAFRMRAAGRSDRVAGTGRTGRTAAGGRQATHEVEVP